MSKSHPVKEILSFDALAAAEELTGESYKTDKDTEMLGLALHMRHGRLKDAVLRQRGDTTLMNDKEPYIAIVESIGFEEMLWVPFKGHDDQDEELLVFARRDGCLLVFDTYGGNHVNGGHVYYNWRPSAEVIKEKAWHRFTSSGGWARREWGTPIKFGDVWSGNHDCREALVFNLDMLAANGELIAPWVEAPSVWLLHYMDTKTQSTDGWKSLRAERIAMLPEWVRKMMGS